MAGGVIALCSLLAIPGLLATSTGYLPADRMPPKEFTDVNFLAAEAKRYSTVLFEDLFDTLNASRWQHEITMSGGGNWEFEYYLNNRTNSFVVNNTLFLRPTLTADRFGQAALENGLTLDLWGGQPAASCTNNFEYGCTRSSSGGNIVNPIQSARIRSLTTFTMTYGRIEVVAKLPKGDWIWPAIWMLPVDNDFGDWPASGEIDIMESRGNGPEYGPGGNNKFSSTLHWGPGYPYDGWKLTHGEYTADNATDLTDNFHTYGLYWSPAGIITYIDDITNTSKHTLSVRFNQSFWDRAGWNMTGMDNPWNYSTAIYAPFDRKFHLILNVAVGGTGGYFPDGAGGKPWSDASQHAATDFWNGRGQWQPTWPKNNDVALQVKSVRVLGEQPPAAAAAHTLHHPRS